LKAEQSRAERKREREMLGSDKTIRFNAERVMIPVADLFRKYDRDTVIVISAGTTLVPSDISPGSIARVEYKAVTPPSTLETTTPPPPKCKTYNFGGGTAMNVCSTDPRVMSSISVSTHNSFTTSPNTDYDLRTHW
jgi:hypothetical protein